MRTITIVRELYTFNELSDKAKDNARDWYRQIMFEDTMWAEGAVESIIEAASMLGITIKKRNGDNGHALYWSVSYCQGDGVGFHADYAYVKGSVKSVRKQWPQDKGLHAIAETLQNIQKRHKYAVTVSCSSGGHSGDNGVSNVTITSAHSLTGEQEDILLNEIKDALNDFAGWAYNLMREESDYCSSQEYLDEGIECNDYEFDINGNIA